MGRPAIPLAIVAAVTAAALAGCSSTGGDHGLTTRSTCGAYRGASTAQQDTFGQHWVDQHHPRDYNGRAGLDDVEYELALLCAKNTDQSIGDVLTAQFDTDTSSRLHESAVEPTVPDGGGDGAASSSSAPMDGAPADCATSQDVRDQISSAFVTYSSYDYRHLAADEAKVQQVTTPAQFAQFRKAIDPQARQITKIHMVIVGTIRAVGYIDGGCDAPRFLVAGDQSTTNTTYRQPRVDPYTVILQLRYSTGRYLIDDLTAA